MQTIASVPMAAFSTTPISTSTSTSIPNTKNNTSNTENSQENSQKISQENSQKKPSKTLNSFVLSSDSECFMRLICDEYSWQAVTPVCTACRGAGVIKVSSSFTGMAVKNCPLNCKGYTY